jgi:hypothetical protein
MNILLLPLYIVGAIIGIIFTIFEFCCKVIFSLFIVVVAGIWWLFSNIIKVPLCIIGIICFAIMSILYDTGFMPWFMPKFKRAFKIKIK